jgi:hypothetical protein
MSLEGITNPEMGALRRGVILSQSTVLKCRTGLDGHYRSRVAKA